MAGSQMGDEDAVRTRVYDAHEAGVPTLVAFSQAGHVGDFAVAQDCVIMRDGSAADGLAPNERAIALPAAIVSRRHGRVGASGGRCFYRDEGSTHGTLLNGVPISGTVELRTGDELGFAPGGVAASTAVKLVFARTVRGQLFWNRIPLDDDVAAISVGRAGEAGGVALSDEYLSRRHAVFELDRSGDGVRVTAVDEDSTNGVFIGGRRIAGSEPVGFFDVVRIGHTWVVRLADELWVGSDYPACASVDAARKVQAVAWPSADDACDRRIVREGTFREVAPQAEGAAIPGASLCGSPSPSVRNGGIDQARAASAETELGNSLLIDIRERSVSAGASRKTLLKDVRLRVEPGDFMLVLGGSGAGKTTLLNAVMGIDKADGSVRYGDLDVYEDYDRIKYDIGYVPQKDLVRLNDTVYYTLLSAAQLRMPARSSRAECRARAEWAAEMLGLSPEMDTVVGNLSGGQLKRLSSAIELVGDPALFFLDEPDSGLDGMMARSLMNNLRSIADLGKIVIVITHGPDRAAHLFTKVLVLAKSELEGWGQMAFFGTVAEAKEFFGVETLEGIVSKINRRDEGGEGLADFFIDKWKGARV